MLDMLASAYCVKEDVEDKDERKAPKSTTKNISLADEPDGSTMLINSRDLLLEFYSKRISMKVIDEREVSHLKDIATIYGEVVDG